ncbi:MAG: ATP-dependent RNA helicase HrpA [Thermodesulfatator sp.]|nr:MAG: ATP-dependent RNA helicase HrpA [Thermodesulfatator sp.]
MSTSRIKCQPGLPICKFWDRLVNLIKSNQVVILTGETGSGKSTQLPKICLAAGRGQKRQIACTQPRRIAAVSLAQRVARELQNLGHGIVGYKIRFHNRTDHRTRIKFLTDGMLLAEMQNDPRLSAYDTVILDEAHERSLNIDLISGMLKRLLKKRKDLKLVITSATMEVDKFRSFFNNPPLFHIKGRTYPVEILYEPDNPEENDTSMEMPARIKQAVLKIRRIDPFGHILAFLPTERDILEARKLLTGALGDQCLILPLFSRLSHKDQARLFTGSTKQKIVLATNIAETSITVPGIRYVVDSGLARISTYNVNSHTRALPISRISRASADQRAGRAGRVEAGICLRLYSREDYLSRPEHTPPEILRCNLAEVILKLLNLGQGPMTRFPMVDPPPRNAIREGMHTLKELGALNSRERLTGLGRKMARLPLDPRLSRIIIQGIREGCTREILVIVSALSIQDPRQRPLEKESEAISAHKLLRDEESDFITWILLWDKWCSLRAKGTGTAGLKKFCTQNFLSYPRMKEWEDILYQILDTVNEMQVTKRRLSRDDIKFSKRELSRSVRDAVHRSVLSGFLGNIAFKKGKNAYCGIKGKELYIFPGSCLFQKRPQWIVSAEQVRTSRLFARTVAPVKPEWIEEFGKELCKYSYLEPRWSASRGEAVCTEKVALYGLTIVPGRLYPLKKVDRSLAREILIRDGLCECRLKNRFPFNEKNRRLLEKIRDMEERQRSPGPLVEQDVLEDFFSRAIDRLEEKTGIEIADEADLKKAMKMDPVAMGNLVLRKEDLLQKSAHESTGRLYPGHIDMAGQRLQLTYRFCPGLDEDGITVRVPLAFLPRLDKDALEWLVPGFLQEKVEFILKYLPKNIRRTIFDYEKAAEEICRAMDSSTGTFQENLKEQVKRLTGIELQENDLAAIPELPSHLVMRIELVGEGGAVIERSRDLEALQKKYLQASRQSLFDSPLWKTACSSWEKPVDLKELDEIPRSIHVGTMKGGLRITAYPALVPHDRKPGVVQIKLFPDKKEAIDRSMEGINAILSQKLGKEIRYLSKLVKNRLNSQLSRADVKSELPIPVVNVKQLCTNTVELITRKHFGKWNDLPSKQDIDQRVVEIRKTMIADAEALLQQITRTVFAFNAYLVRRKKISRQPVTERYAASVLPCIDELAQLLLDEAFPADRSVEFIKEMPRFARGLDIRLQRALENPAKDLDKQKRFEKFLPVLRKTKDLRQSKKTPEDGSLDETELLVWEYMLSIFAPELSIRGRIPKGRMDSILNILEQTPYQ